MRNPHRKSRPSRAARFASRAVYLYLRYAPFQTASFSIWRFAARRFLVKQLEAGPWIRASGLTDAERSLFMGETKEPRSVQFVRGLLKPRMTAIDVGANVGYYSLIFADRVGPDGHVHSFEPTPAVAARLKQNIELNGFNHVRVNQTAVSNYVGQASLHMSSDDPEANSLSGTTAGTRIDVQTVTLDAYAAAQNIGSIDFVKIDCEGSELDVLKGATGRLTGDHPPILVLEGNPEALRSFGASVRILCEFLKSLSYECYVLEQLVHDPNPVWNIVAAKSVHFERFPIIADWRLEKFEH